MVDCPLFKSIFSIYVYVYIILTYTGSLLFHYTLATACQWRPVTCEMFSIIFSDVLHGVSSQAQLGELSTIGP